MGSRSKSSKKTENSYDIATDNRNYDVDNRDYSDNSSIDSSIDYNDTSQTSIHAEDNRSESTVVNTLDGGSIDALNNVSVKSLEAGERTSYAAITSAERAGAAALKSITSSAGNAIGVAGDAISAVSSNTKDNNALTKSVYNSAINSNNNVFNRSLDAITGTLGTAFGESLAFIDDKTETQSEKLTEQSQENMKMITLALVGIVGLPIVLRTFK